MAEVEAWEQAAARDLLDRFGARAARQGHPVFLELRTVTDGRLLTSEVTGREGLLGRLVRPPWTAVAVVGTGRIVALDEAHEPPAALVPGLAGGLRIASVVGRDGAVGWRMLLPDGSAYDRVPEEGFMLDVLRRSLQLPTPPPPRSMAPLEMAAWLVALGLAGSMSSARMGWHEALRMHPVAWRWPDAGDEDLESIVRIGSFEWDSLRMFVAAGGPGQPATGIHPPPELAAWMDEGMFARWMLREVPPLELLLPDVRPHLQPGAYRRLAHLVRSLDRSTVGG